MRRRSHQLHCGRTHDFLLHAEAQSATDREVYHKEYLLGLVGAASQEQEGFGLSHLLQEGFGASGRACRRGKGRGKKLVTEEPNPVGSGTTIYSMFIVLL